MNKTPQELVIRFIETRDAIRAAFRWESEYIYPACAHIFLAADRAVDRERLERCKAMVKSTTGPFSSFRGNIKLPLICMLAAGDEPEARWEGTERTYGLLKEAFFSSEYLALAALILSEEVPETDIPALAARGKGLYQRMKKEHPFLTGQEDSVFALLLAESQRTDDELIDDMEACYRLLDERFLGHILAEIILQELAPGGAGGEGPSPDRPLRRHSKGRRQVRQGSAAAHPGGPVPGQGVCG